MEPRLNT